MRKSFLITKLMVITGLTIWSCTSTPETATTEPMRDICLAPARIKPKDTLPEDKNKQTEFYGNNEFKWKKYDTLNVYFFDGNDSLRKNVLKIANEWSNYAPVKFKIVTNKPNSQIRVAFGKGGGFASLIGKQALLPKYKDEPTVYLDSIGKFQYSQPVRFRRIILHEFGHVMGLEHEIKNPGVAIPWDSAAVIKYYNDYYGWDSAKAHKNIFEKATNTYSSEYDPKSIMIYAIPDTLIKDKSFKTEWSNELSAVDKSYISKWYKK